MAYFLSLWAREGYDDGFVFTPEHRAAFRESEELVAAERSWPLRGWAHQRLLELRAIAPMGVGRGRGP